MSTLKEEQRKYDNRSEPEEKPCISCKFCAICSTTQETCEDYEQKES